jgi:hypothetical protein
LMVIGAAKVVIAGAVTPVPSLLLGIGAVLLTLGIVAPRRLSAGSSLAADRSVRRRRSIRSS